MSRPVRAGAAGAARTVAARASPATRLRSDVTALKRERILETAAELFYAQGYLRTSVDAIAERLGATKPFVYHHFRSKVDLLVEICELGTREALEALDAALRAPGTPTERFTRFVDLFARIALKNHRYVAIYFREQLNLPAAADDRIMAMRESLHRKLRQLLAQGVAAGEFALADTGLGALVVAGMSSYAFAWYREGGRLGVEAATERIVAMALALVRRTEARA